MKGEKEIQRNAALLFLAGFVLIGFVLFVPDAGHHHVWSFAKTALSSSWRRPFDPVCVWCSVKIILLSLGLFLAIESLGTSLAIYKRQVLAFIVYLFHVVPCFGMLFGLLCLVKALI